MVINLKLNTQSENKRKKQLSVYDLALCGLFSAILFVAQVVFAFLPNIEFVTLLIIVYTLVFKKRTILIIYIFALLEGLVYGFGIWWIMYLYVWTILYFIVNVFRKNDSSIGWAVIGGFFGLSYGLLCSIPYAVAGGMNMGIAWWIKGIPFDIIHGIGNFVIILVLFKPIYNMLKKMHHSFQGRISYKNE